MYIWWILIIVLVMMTLFTSSSSSTSSLREESWCFAGFHHLFELLNNSWFYVVEVPGTINSISTRLIVTRPFQIIADAVK